MSHSCEVTSYNCGRITGYTEVIPVGWKTRISWKWPGLFDQVKRGKHPLYICAVWRDVLERGKELAVTVRDSNQVTGQRSNQLNYVPNRGINSLA